MAGVRIWTEEFSVTIKIDLFLFLFVLVLFLFIFLIKKTFKAVPSNEMTRSPYGDHEDHKDNDDDIGDVRSFYISW